MRLKKRKQICTCDAGYNNIDQCALCAASPKLLEALKALRKHYSSFYGPLWDAAEEAIYEAEHDHKDR